MTTDDPGGGDDATTVGRRAPADASAGDGAARYATLVRGPRIAALVGAGTALATSAVNLLVLEQMSGLLFAVTVPAALVCALSIRNIVNFSPRTVARLQPLTVLLGGRFSLWKAGTGGHVGSVFEHGAEHERFGVVAGTLRGMPVEMGHLSSQVSTQHRAPGGRRHGYVVIRLPERLPHMIVSFGHLSRVLGVRVAPDQWHRSQRVDVGGGRGFRLFVADGGEAAARAFFTPEVVALLERVGRSFDVEIRNRSLSLLADRSPAAGSERRWADRWRLLEELAGSLAGSEVWEVVGRRSRRLRNEPLRADVARSVAVVLGVAAVAVVVLSLVVLTAGGHIG